MNTKMKVLALALLGLAGYAGSAVAGGCPASPVPPWTDTSTTGGTVAIADGGLDGSLCRMDSSITANLGSASAFVHDQTPAAEPHYRSQFLINADALAGQNSTMPVRVFAATTATPANSVPDVVTLSIFGNAAGTARVLGISTACASSATFRCGTTATLTPTGVNTVEIEWVQGAAGTAAMRVWVNNGDEANPTAQFDATLDNSAWGGVDDAFLGLTAASANYRGQFLNAAVGFDKFDSRRSTFIGL
jgi:hypothetical protein